MATISSANLDKVPWHNPKVFMRVYERIFSDILDNKKEAVNEISVWEKMCHPSLPSAIEATLLLTRAVIQDILWTNETTVLQYADLQAIYGSAITRFVSLCVDNNKSSEWFRFCTSAHIAKSICIPSYIVDIRNEWCHSNTPSLSILRIAVQSALKYLKEFYWDKEVAHLRPYVKQPPDERQLFYLFKRYIQFNEDVFAGVKTRYDKSDRGASKINHEYSILMKDLEKYLKKNVEIFVKVLVSDGIFIPTDEDLQQKMSKQEYEKFTFESYLEENYSGIEEEEVDKVSMEENYSENEEDEVDKISFEENNFPKIPQYHEILWEPVIILLNKYDAVPIFMEHLLKSQGDRTVAGQKLLISWIVKLLGVLINPTFVDSYRSKKLKKFFRTKGITPNWNRLLHSAVINPCKYIMKVLPLILPHVSIEYSAGHKIIGLLSIKLRMLSDDKRKFYKDFHTAEELESGLERQRNADKEKDDRADIWSLCPDKCYKTWTTGAIINPILEDEGIGEEEFESIFTCVPDKNEFKDRILPSNKNEEEDDDHTSQTVKVDLRKMILEIKKKDTVLLRRPD